jgi:AraC family transcriptional regulator, arabinose operon regulatory protein
VNRWERTISQAFERRDRNAPVFTAGGMLGCGYETRTDPRGYDWHGLRRGGDAVHPFALIQYTFSGFGCFEQGGITNRLGLGDAFACVIPSDHRYFLPRDSDHWTFFWIILRQPYAVRRLAESIAVNGSVRSLAPQSRLFKSLVNCFRRICLADFEDALETEQCCFELVVEYERFVDRSRHPSTPRDRLMDEVRQAVLKNLSRWRDVQSLAGPSGMSRSHFSHHFKATTGLSPAAFATQVRLEEACRMLTQSDSKLSLIARQTGFADANHFCKVFRRHYHVSPGVFRRQIWVP